MWKRLRNTAHRNLEQMSAFVLLLCVCVCVYRNFDMQVCILLTFAFSLQRATAITYCCIVTRSAKFCLSARRHATGNFSDCMRAVIVRLISMCDLCQGHIVALLSYNCTLNLDRIISGNDRYLKKSLFVGQGFRFVGSTIRDGVGWCALLEHTTRNGRC